jgi:hypothetical protein
MWEFGKLIGAVWGFCCSAWRLVFVKTKYRNCDVGHVCGVMLFSFMAGWRVFMRHGASCIV